VSWLSHGLGKSGHPSCRVETIFPRRLNLKREASIDLGTASTQTK